MNRRLLFSIRLQTSLQCLLPAAAKYSVLSLPQHYGGIFALFLDRAIVQPKFSLDRSDNWRHSKEPADCQAYWQIWTRILPRQRHNFSDYRERERLQSECLSMQLPPSGEKGMYRQIRDRMLWKKKKSILAPFPLKIAYYFSNR